MNAWGGGVLPLLLWLWDADRLLEECFEDMMRCKSELARYKDRVFEIFEQLLQPKHL